MNSDFDTMDTAHSDKFDNGVDARENVLNNIDSDHQSDRHSNHSICGWYSDKFIVVWRYIAG